MKIHDFIHRHNGPQDKDLKVMLSTIGVSSIDELIEKTIPARIRLSKPLNLPDGISEHELIAHMKSMGAKNKQYRSFIGQGYYSTVLPPVLQRNILENPGWYTAYTPYQAEISQGRLEILFTYQTMICSLTSMPLANASLLDEATAAAEMMLMFYGSRSREQVKNGVNKCFVAEDLFPQTIAVIQTRAESRGIELIFGNPETFDFNDSFFGAIIQYGNNRGEIIDYTEVVKKVKDHGLFIGVVADLLSLALLTPPGEWGADCVCGTTQRFGLPMAYGGPATGYFACLETFKRQMPGRIVGKSVDVNGKPAFRLALQTREQHIKREKATSNICTASALMAILNAMYACWHGPEGIKAIALNAHHKAEKLAVEAEKLGFKQLNRYFFDTVAFETPNGISAKTVCDKAVENKMNFYEYSSNVVCISTDELTTRNHVEAILKVFAGVSGKEFQLEPCCGNCKHTICLPENLIRKSNILTEEIFSKYHSETDMMRYLKKQEIKDLSLNRAMIPLGSCTMKLNAAAEMFPLSWSEYADVHPFVPSDQAEGYHEMISEMDKILCEVTGFAKTSFQPNSGASGEYAGLVTIRNYQKHHNEGHRNICLIPSSAHGTNPASAAMAGLQVVVVKATSNGEVDVEDLKTKAEQHKNNLSCLMITYPSTHGVFEEAISDIIKIIHDNGGLVYMDGANMNAQVGLTCPGYMGADVCHLNLHKTFAMPHGGGGPGVGPIAVCEKLKDFLPNHSVVSGIGGSHGSQVSSSPYGYAQLLTITYAYLKLLGGNGLVEATKYAILNANYIKARLSKAYNILYVGQNGMCAHEMILDCNPFNLSSGVQCGDIAKRLMDYGFHAPTVAFPVHGTLMIEPTESEPLSELDRLCDALISIRQEIKDIEDGKADKENNVVINAPHPMEVICADKWDKPYTRQQAAFPMAHDDKYWPTTARIDDAFGDRNLCVHWDK